MLDDVTIDALAVYRLTRLATSDAIFDGPRAQFVAWAKRCSDLEIGDETQTVCMRPDSKLAYLATCPWCMSIWFGLIAVIARRKIPRAWRPVARLLAFSAVAGIASDRVS